MEKPLLVLFMDLGLGGIQRKIVEIVNFLADYRPELPIYILLRRKTKFDGQKEIRNKKVKVINYQDWVKFRLPLFFPIFIFYQIWSLKPQAVLAFLNYVSLPAIWAKYLFFWRKIRVVLSEDYFTSMIIPTDRLALLHHFLIRTFYPFADVVFSCTQATKKDLMVSYKIPRRKIRIIRNWTSFVNKKIAPIPRKYDLIYTGRLVKTKNVILLLRGVKSLKRHKPNVKLCIVGGGEEGERLKKFVEENKLKKNVYFIGVQDEVEKFLNRAKIFVYSSEPEVEGFPLSILEAMALGMPILASKFRGVKEAIKDRENGLIFDSLEDFVKKALWLLNNPDQRKLIGEKARFYIKKYHSPENIEVYLQALGLKNNGKKIKIGIITSRGGHLFQLYQLADWWKRYERFWLTDRGGDSDFLLKGEKVYYGYFPESRNILNAIRNFFFGLRVLLKEKPDLLISCGAGIAPPIFYVGKILRIKLFFIEPYDFIEYPSLSGRLVTPIVDKLLVQHKIQKKFFEKAEYWGATL